jgi:hypothetical protein
MPAARPRTAPSAADPTKGARLLIQLLFAQPIWPGWMEAVRITHEVPQRTSGHTDSECPGYRVHRVWHEPDRPLALAQVRDPFLVLALDLPKNLGRVVTDLIIDPLVVFAA